MVPAYPTKIISASASIKDIDGKKGIMTGYFSKFGNVDSDEDVLVQGSFLKTIQERGPQSALPRIKHLRNHLIYEPVGPIQTLKEDAIGVYYETMPGTHMVGRDTVLMAESGVITEHSFGFETIKADMLNNIRYIKEVRMWEGSSLTAWGANELTGAAMMKSMGKEAYAKLLSDRLVAVEKFCRNSTATDETIELLLIESKQLLQFIQNLTTGTEPDKSSTQPQDKGLIDTIKSFALQLN